MAESSAPASLCQIQNETRSATLPLVCHCGNVLLGQHAQQLGFRVPHLRPGTYHASLVRERVDDARGIYTREAVYRDAGLERGVVDGWGGIQCLG